MPPDGISPVAVTVSPPSPVSGQNVEFTVGLSGNALGTEVYNVSPSPSGSFSSYPSTVSPAAGANQLTFPATASSSYAGAASVNVADADGNGATCHMKISPVS